MTDATLVTLSVAGQRCAIPVADVRDVLNTPMITRIPLAAPEIAGSLNLRGRIVTALDVRRRLGLPELPPDTPRMSLVTEQGGDLYALLVDTVLEVITLRGQDLEPPPPTLLPAWSRHCTGIFQLPDGLLVMLDVRHLLGCAP